MKFASATTAVQGTIARREIAGGPWRDRDTPQLLYVLVSLAADPSKPEGLISKIAKMTVAQCLKLALPGTKEERAFLIRNGGKVIQRAVLSSPKVTGGEVEKFAVLKNVNQDVLRQISMNRKFIDELLGIAEFGQQPTSAY